MSRVSTGARIAFACLVPLLGAGVLGISLYSAYSTHRMVSLSVQSDGTVIQMVQAKNSLDTRPVVRFRAEDGRFHTFLSGAASNPPLFKVGQQVTIFYPKGHPEQARIDSFVGLYALTSFGILFGAAMIAWGILVFLQMRRGMGPPEIRIRTSYITQ